MSLVNPTPDEQSLISTIFSIADPQNLGIITGDAAVKVLSGANLSNSVLGEVWSLADKENNGFLTRNGVAVAVRLIGYAQKGQSVLDLDLLSKPGPLADIEGISLSSKPSSDRSETLLPPLTQQDKTKFLKLFVSCGPSNGLLSSDKARDVFVKSNLPYEKLSQIWNLADSKVRGALDATDFIVGMYFLQLCMTSPLSVLPSTLPPSLYEQASLTPDSSNKNVASHATGNSFSGSPASPHTFVSIMKHSTGQSSSVPLPGAVRPQYTGQHSASGSPGPTTRPTQGDSSPQTRLPTDIIFDQLDTQHRGYIEADVAVPFMIKTGLSSTDLAQIWDLADMNNDGRLTRTGFAVAMRLISSKLAGSEIPQTLPPNFASSPTPSQLHFPKATAVSDLDLLIDTPSLPTVRPQGTGGNNQWNPQNGVFANPPVSPAQQPQLQQSPILIRDPTLPVLAQTVDLLGDEEDGKAAVPDHSVEIGNLQNQLSSTTRSLEIAKTEKQSAEKNVQQQAEELAQLQTQLATARASYEMETKLLGDLRDRTLSQQVDISKIRGELITAEGELSAVKVERNDIQSALLRDKEEVRELQRKLKEVGAETETLKAELEKLKRDARQQKGLLAIAKKQLATAESERLKAHKEIEATEAELDAIMKERSLAETKISELTVVVPAENSSNPLVKDTSENTERVSSPIPSVVAAAVPLPLTPAPSSPPAPRQSTNPFDLLILGTVSSPALETNGLIDTEDSVTSPSAFTDFVSSVEAGSPPTFAHEDVVQPHAEETRPTSAEQFPEVDLLSPENTASPKFDAVEDVLSPLHEIENEDSDSEDEEPLSNLKEKASKAANGTVFQTHESGTEVNGFRISESSHENMFDLPVSNTAVASFESEPTQAQSNPSLADDPFGVPIPSTSPTMPFDDEHLPAGKITFESSIHPATIKDFDEGFNNIPQPSKEISFNSKFESDFDDFFDFTKIATENEQPRIEPQVGNQASESRMPDHSPALFTRPTESNNSLRPQSTLVSDRLPPVVQQPQITFDDILQLSAKLTTDDTPAISSAPANVQQESAISTSSIENQYAISPAPQTTENTNPFPIPFSNEIEHRAISNSSPTPRRSHSPSIRPSSPPIRPSSPPIRPSSPPRQPRVSIGLSKNSPPGASSPKPKPSGSGSKVSENKPENPPKHKLTIRLFGKKDKKDKDDKRGPPKHQGQSLDSPQAVPSFAEPFATGIVTGTPASDDDVEAVKQLSAMGFTRSQAVAALEAHGYDMQRALNSLLGAS